MELPCTILTSFHYAYGEDGKILAKVKISKKRAEEKQSFY